MRGANPGRPNSGPRSRRLHRRAVRRGTQRFRTPGPGAHRESTSRFCGEPLKFARLKLLSLVCAYEAVKAPLCSANAARELECARMRLANLSLPFLCFMLVMMHARVPTARCRAPKANGIILGSQVSQARHALRKGRHCKKACHVNSSSKQADVSHFSSCLSKGNTAGFR